MQKNFVSVEEMIADDMFLSWFYKESDEKVQEWEKWLGENPGYQPLASEAARLMDTLNIYETPVSSFRVEAAYNKLNAKLEELDNDMAPVVTMKPFRRRWWIGAAAAVFILFAGLAYFKFSSSKPVIETQYGQLSQQVLPDGSQVMLNANTTVTLSKDWKEGDDREVWLKGEAFFHVKKTAQKNRFIVHTDQLDVIVTGTQFNVSTRDDKTSVLLTEGSVTIKTSDGEEILMEPGDFVEIHNNKAEKKTTNEEAVLAWKENKLNFEKTPMKEVAAMISNHYGVTVKLADDSVGEKTITGMMPNNNLDDLLKALEATADFKITRTDKTILIAKP
jgi:ferric-dicitrate binding protein FerR (iron transport regulator)